MNNSPSNFNRLAVPAAAVLSLSALQACATTHNQVDQVLNSPSSVSDKGSQVEKKAPDSKDYAAQMGLRVPIGVNNGVARPMAYVHGQAFSHAIDSSGTQLIGGLGVATGEQDTMPYASLGASLPLGSKFHLESGFELGANIEHQNSDTYPVTAAAVNLNYAGLLYPIDIRYQTGKPNENDAGELVVGSRFGCTF